jgi:formylglycine-generating enzyme required for sulfatase activity
MEFVGWGSQPGNYGINYRAGSTFLMGKADIVLYAKWYYSSEMQMASVAAGSFRMGILGFSNATPDHAVTLPAFLIGKYEVTQYQFEAITGTNPSWFQGGVDASLRPVEMVSWFDAIEFCNLLSLNDGYEAVYAIAGRTPASGYPITAATVTQNRTKNGYRLPTEAEWEYAAKGGNGSPGRYTYSGSDDADSVGWYLANSLKTTHSVGSKLGNGLGIFDMSGNVWEWCWDRYDSYPSDEQSDPEGPVTGDRRILRGGEWAYSAGNLVTTWRTILWPDLFGNGFGFRVVRRP